MNRLNLSNWLNPGDLPKVGSVLTPGNVGEKEPENGVLKLLNVRNPPGIMVGIMVGDMVIMPFVFMADCPKTICASALLEYPSPKATATAATTMNRFIIAPLVSKALHRRL